MRDWTGRILALHADMHAHAVRENGLEVVYESASPQRDAGSTFCVASRNPGAGAERLQAYRESEVSKMDRRSLVRTGYARRA